MVKKSNSLLYKFFPKLNFWTKSVGLIQCVEQKHNLLLFNNYSIFNSSVIEWASEASPFIHSLLVTKRDLCSKTGVILEATPELKKSQSSTWFETVNSLSLLKLFKFSSMTRTEACSRMISAEHKLCRVRPSYTYFYYMRVLVRHTSC